MKTNFRIPSLVALTLCLIASSAHALPNEVISKKAEGILGGGLGQLIINIENGPAKKDQQEQLQQPSICRTETSYVLSDDGKSCLQATNSNCGLINLARDMNPFGDGAQNSEHDKKVELSHCSANLVRNRLETEVLKGADCVSDSGVACKTLCTSDVSAAEGKEWVTTSTELPLSDASCISTFPSAMQTQVLQIQKEVLDSFSSNK